MTGRCLRLLLPACCVLLALHTPCDAQTSPPTAFVLDIENASMRRDAGIVTAAGQLTHRATEAVLDAWLPQMRERGARGAALRLAQVWLVSMPIASLTDVVIHERGHVAHVSAKGFDYDVSITGWPWPVPLTSGATSYYGVSDLSIIAGGSEGAFVHETLVADRIYQDATAHYFDWGQFLYAKMDTILYAWSDLWPRYFDDEAAFYADDDLGDPRQFVIAFEQARQDTERPAIDTIRSRASSLRHRALTSLADLTLVSAVVRGLQYVVRGDRDTPPLFLTIGSVKVVPALHFVLTGEGYEHRASARVLYGNDQLTAYVRQITAPIDDSLTGVGAAWRHPLSSGTTIVANADVWRQDTTGFRLEAGAERAAPWLANGMVIGLRAGYKTRGFLEGYRESAGVVFGATARMKF